MVFLLIVFAAQCFGYSPKLQGFMDQCTSVADKNLFGGVDHRKFACLSNMGVYITTTTTIQSCNKYRGEEKTHCINVELSKESKQCEDVCKSKFKSELRSYGGLICKDNCPGFIMAKYPDIFYPNKGASTRTRYKECYPKCYNAFHFVDICKGGCLGNIASEYLQPGFKAENIKMMKQELTYCKDRCGADNIAYNTCVGSCVGAVMGKYKLQWYGKAEFGDEEKCRYVSLGYKNTDGGYSFQPCLMKHQGDCLTYRVDETYNAHAGWDNEADARAMCMEWPACRGYWQQSNGIFWAMDLNSVRDLKKKTTWDDNSRGAFEKVCGVASKEKFVKREVANCGSYAPITTKKECVQAAEDVGLVGQISNPHEGTYSADPKGCWYATNLQTLNFNHGGTDSKDTIKISLCKGSPGTESKLSSKSKLLHNLLEMLMEEALA